MTQQPRPCYRHRSHLWMVNCPECTAYHLAAVIGRRDGDRTASRRVTSVAA